MTILRVLILCAALLGGFFVAPRAASADFWDGGSGGSLYQDSWGQYGWGQQLNPWTGEVYTDWCRVTANGACY